MPISDEAIIDAAHVIADVKGVEADARTVLEDAFLLAQAFTSEADYLSAVANTVRALHQLAEGAVSPAQLKYNHHGWLSYHYQHKVSQGARADMRIVFMPLDGIIRLRAFGHRNLPKNFYERLAETR